MKYCIKLITNKLVEISKEDYESFLTILDLGYETYVDYDECYGPIKVIERLSNNER